MNEKSYLVLSDLLLAKGSFLYGNAYESSKIRRAFDINDSLKCTLTVPRQLGAVSAKVFLQDLEFGKTKTVPLKWVETQNGNDLYSCNFPKLQVGLYSITVEIQTLIGLIYIHSDGAFQKDPYSFQLTIFHHAYPNPSFANGGMIYQIFVDRFAKGKKELPIRDGALLASDWDHDMVQFPEYPGAPLKNNLFFGGSLYGIMDKLDYLSSLGVTIIYLSPIFDSVSNHKYDTGDYMHVDEMFGGDTAFQLLLKKAKKYRMEIILDGVFNHTGSESLYFNKKGSYPSVGAYQSKDSPYFNWYYFKNYPDSYESWWNIDILPKLNLHDESLKQYFLGDEGVIAKWSKAGIGGFRLDVVDELTDEFVERIHQVMASKRKDAILFGEVWEDASNKIAYDKRRHYYQGKQLDGVMNYPVRRGILSFLRDHDSKLLHYALEEVFPNMPKRQADCQMNLIGTHDTIRVLTALAGDSPEAFTNQELAYKKLTNEQRNKGIVLLKLAYLILFTLPGLPLLYYGDEIGMEGYADPFNRMPFTWNSIDQNLLQFIKTLSAFRKNHVVYREGLMKVLYLTDEICIFKRYSLNESALTVINLSSYSIELEHSSFLLDIYGQQKKKVEVLPSSGNIYRYQGKDVKIFMDNKPLL